MSEQIEWLREVHEGPWTALAKAQREGQPVPDGFVASIRTSETSIRQAYEDLKPREHTHYMAVRGPAGAQLDVIGPDWLIHTMRRCWNESPDCQILAESMVNGTWCGKARREGRNLRIRASQGLICLDPDMYLINVETGKLTRRTLHQRPRKVFRGVDGTTRTMEIIGERRPLELKYLQAIVDLSKRTDADITWVLDDRRVWLIGVDKSAG